MSKKMYALIATIAGAVGAVAAAFVTFYQPPYAAAINGSLEIITSGVISCCALFISDKE